jgi:hypothetical protein
MLIIDGVEYSDKVVVSSIRERSEKVYGDAVTMKQNGDNSYDVIGTKYIHTVVLSKNPQVPQSETNALFSLLSDPVESHTVTLPHDEDEITYKAHVSVVERELLDKINGRYIWADDMTVEFQPISPQIRSE